MFHKWTVFSVVAGLMLVLTGVFLFQRTSPGNIKTIKSAAKTLEDPVKSRDANLNHAGDGSQVLGASVGHCKYIPILMYHHIDNKPGSLYVNKEIFAKQMDYLVQRGYNTVTLPEIIENLNSSSPLPSRPIVITFDDGYQDNYLNAYPVLSSRSLRATIFVVTQLVGGGEYLTWDQILEMSNNPIITIGDHTLSHLALAKLPLDRVRDEIVSAKNILEEKLGKTVNVFAYPYGSKNAQVEKMLKEGGFVAAVTNRRGLQCAKLPYELNRIRVGNAQLSAYGL